MPMKTPESFHKYLRRAFINNSFGEVSSHVAAKHAWENSFSYLQYTQREICNFTYYHVNLQGKSEDVGNPRKVYFNKAYKPSIDVDRRIINITKDESDYKKSEFYKKEIDAETISNNPLLFNKLPVIVVDNHVIMDYKVLIYDQYLTISLPTTVAFIFQYKRSENGDKRIYSDSDIHILLIPNKGYKQITVDTSTLKNTHNISIDKSNLNLPLDSNGIMMCSFYITKPEEKRIYPKHNVRTDGTIQWDHRFGTKKDDFDFEASTMLYDMSETEDSFTCELPQEAIDKINSNPNGTTYIHMIFFNNLHCHEYYTSDKLAHVYGDSSSTLACIMKNSREPWNMSIPIENVLLFKQNSTNNKILYNLDNIEGFYPNFYKIIDKDMSLSDEYKLFYFYTPGYDLHYTCIHDFFFYFISLRKDSSTDFIENLEEYMDKLYNKLEDLPLSDEVSNEDFYETLLHILTYYSYIHRYKDLDMVHNFYNSVNPYAGRSAEYKSERLLDYTKYEPYVLRDYVLEQKKKGAPFIIFTKSLNLEDRLRNDTNEEFENIPDKAYTFEEPHYVFSAINNEPFDHPSNMRVFVDGLFVMDLYLQRNEFTQYFYIPARLVTDDSVIEVEFVKRFYMEKKLTFTSMDQKETIVCAANDPVSLPTLADLVIYDDLEFDQPIHRYEYRHFDVSVKNEAGEFATSIGTRNKKLRFVHLDKFTMKPATEEVLNKPLKIRLSKSAEGIRYIVPRDGRLFLEFVDNTFGYNKEYLRIFVNGRLLPREEYVFYPMYHYPRIKFLYDLHKDDVLFIDVTPYRYRQICYLPDIYNTGVLEYRKLQRGVTPDPYPYEWVDSIAKRVVSYDFYDYNHQISSKEANNPDGEKEIMMKIREKLPLDGVLDLRKIINKPFDLRYYDIYLNGRKLNLENCHVIDPWTIKLNNVHSTSNLLIFEKERDYEYYGLKYETKQLYYAVSELLEKGYITKEERDKIINFAIKENETDDQNYNENDEVLIDEEPDEFNPGFFDKYIYFFFDMFYYKYLILKQYINPDIASISKLVMLDWFEEIYDWYVNNPYDNSHEDEPNGKIRRERYIDCICLNPDLYIVGLGPENSDNYHHGQRVYSLGHLNEVPQNILDEIISIKREITVDKLRKDDLEMDKYLEVREDAYSSD